MFVHSLLSGWNRCCFGVLTLSLHCLLMSVPPALPAASAAAGPSPARPVFGPVVGLSGMPSLESTGSTVTTASASDSWCTSSTVPYDEDDEAGYAAMTRDSRALGAVLRALSCVRQILILQYQRVAGLLLSPGSLGYIGPHMFDVASGPYSAPLAGREVVEFRSVLGEFVSTCDSASDASDEALSLFVNALVLLSDVLGEAWSEPDFASERFGFDVPSGLGFVDAYGRGPYAEMAGVFRDDKRVLEAYVPFRGADVILGLVEVSLDFCMRMDAESGPLPAAGSDFPPVPNPLGPVSKPNPPPGLDPVASGMSCGGGHVPGVEGRPDLNPAEDDDPGAYAVYASPSAGGDPFEVFPDGACCEFIEEGYVPPQAHRPVDPVSVYLDGGDI